MDISNSPSKNESGDEVIKEETFGTNPSRVLVEKAYKAFCFSHNQSNYPADAEHTLHVWGDFAAKLVGVYTGIYDQEPITNWIREL